jgi:small-conductance mechanosensitive channel
MSKLSPTRFFQDSHYTEPSSSHTNVSGVTYKNILREEGKVTDVPDQAEEPNILRQQPIPQAEDANDLTKSPRLELTKTTTLFSDDEHMAESILSSQKTDTHDDDSEDDHESESEDDDGHEDSFIFDTVHFIKKYLWYLIGSIYGLLLISAITLLVVSIFVWPTAILDSLPVSKWMAFIVLVLGSLPCMIIVVQIVLRTLRMFYITRRYIWYHLHQTVPMFVLSLWLLFILVTWVLLMQSIDFYVTASLEALLTFSICILIKQWIMSVVSLYFQRSTFWKRVQNSIFAEFALWKIMQYRNRQELCKDTLLDHHDRKGLSSIDDFVNEAEMSKCVQDPGVFISSDDMINDQKVSSLLSFVRRCDYLKLSHLGNKNENCIIRSRQHAKIEAQRTYYLMKSVDRPYVELSDFVRCFNNTSIAERAFQLFDKDQDGRVRRKAMQETFVEIWQERKKLSESLNDAESVVYKLNILLTFVILAVALCICLFIYGMSVQDLLISLSAVLLAYSFLFGMAMVNLFQSIIYILIIHPYDVGDRCIIETKGMLVKQLNFLTTIFLSDDGTVSYYPNTLLAQKVITNMSRSGFVWEKITFQIDLSTPFEKIKELEKRLRRLAESYPNIFDPHIEFLLTSIDMACNRMEFTLWLKGWTNSYKGSEERANRRRLVMYLIRDAIEELGLS